MCYKIFSTESVTGPRLDREAGHIVHYRRFSSGVSVPCLTDASREACSIMGGWAGNCVLILGHVTCNVNLKTRRNVVNIWTIEAVAHYCLGEFVLLHAVSARHNALCSGRYLEVGAWCVDGPSSL